MDWSPKNKAVLWAEWAIAQPINSTAFLAFTTVPVEPLHNGHNGTEKSDLGREV